MRKLIGSFLLLLAGAAAPLIAQTQTTPFPVPVYYASAFGSWAIQGQSPNTYTFQGRSLCNQSGQNTPFFAFNTNAPVWLADQNTSKSETLTPSAIVQTAGSCGVSISPSNQHYTFSLKSGTGGLQEALNTVATLASVPATIALDRNWWTYANQVPGTSGAAIITAAVGGYGAVIQDITAAPYVNYTWNGTAYGAVANGTVAWINTAPTAAVGAGAGTSPTISIKGTALTGTVSLLTGSATTTGTLFTLTWTHPGQFQNAGTCTVVSQPGATNSYTTFTEATSLASSNRVSTVTVATTAPVAATQYYFNYTCS